ncbi:unnamed protein product [Symbiodinium microadriaticum]|nr:unnamed protein product [Symbiodinium microadriaticum]
MTAQTVIGNFTVEQVIIVKDQFDHIKQPKCLSTGNDALYVLYTLEIVLILFAGRMMWFTRHVASTISSTSTSATAVLNIWGVILTMFILLELVSFEPQLRQFVIGIVIAILCIRVTWILYSTLVINVLMGYDLDKALQLKKMAWSILNVSLLKNAAQVIGYGDTEAPATRLSTQMTEEESYTKAMAKFSKSKNASELQYEIDKIKKEIEERQTELACLENMKFASSESGNSSSSGQKKSSRGEDYISRGDELQSQSSMMGGNPSVDRALQTNIEEKT